MKKFWIKVPGKVPRSLPVFANDQSIRSDYEEAVAVFQEVSLIDPNLKSKLDTHFPVFFYHETDLGGLAQLTPKVVLPNNCTLELQFVAKNSPIKEPPETHNNQTIGETAEIAAASIVVEFINPAEITGGVVEEQDQDTSKDATIWMTLDDQEQSLIQTKKIFKPKSGPSAIRYEDIPLPVFSQRVSNIIKNGKVQEETMPFIHEVGDHLLSLKTNPVKKDIEVYVLFLLNTFPELEKVSTGNADPQKKIGDIIQIMISNYVRNTRRRRNQEMPEIEPKIKKGSIEYYLHRPASTSTIDDPSTENNSSSSSNNGARGGKKRKAIDALDPDDPCSILSKKKATPEDIILHLPTFFDTRRDKLNEFKSVKEIVAAWPNFTNNADVIVKEFELCLQKTMDDIKIDFDNLIEQLGKYYDSEIDSEATKLKLLHKLELELEPSYTLKHPSAFLIQELGDGKEPSKPNKIMAGAPISATYVGSKDDVTKTYLIAERKVICCSNAPSAFKVFGLLLGSYYAFGCEYPNESKNIYHFLERVVLKNSVPNLSPKVKQFLNANFKHIC